MPSRIVRESIRTSPTLAQVSRGAECLFLHLIVTVDDFGRFKSDARIVKGLCFPICDEVTVEYVEAWLEELVRERLLILYIVDSQRYGFLRTWFTHQRPPRAKTSKHPAPPEEMLSNVRHCATSADICKRMLPGGMGYGIEVNGNGVRGMEPASAGSSPTFSESHDQEPAANSQDPSEATITEYLQLLTQANGNPHARDAVVRSFANELHLSEAQARSLLHADSDTTATPVATGAVK